MKVKPMPPFFLDRHLSYVDTIGTEIAISIFPDNGYCPYFRKIPRWHFEVCLFISFPEIP